MRHLQEPLTLPKHPQLLHELNQMSMRIKVWHLMDWSKYTKEQQDKLQAHNAWPEWKEVEELLMQAYRALDQERYNPVKY